MTTWRAHADDLRRYASTLDDAAMVTAGVVTSLTEAWADAAGREWAERLRLVGRELDRLAAVARDRAHEADRRSEAPEGVVLGAQTGTRTTTRRGVVVPTLPTPPP